MYNISFFDYNTHVSQLNSMPYTIRKDNNCKKKKTQITVKMGYFELKIQYRFKIYLLTK